MMEAVKRVGMLVLTVIVLCASALAQSHGGNIAERQKAPTVAGGTGLFNTFSTRTLCKGEFNFAVFWNNMDRDPGDLEINQVPFNFTIGLTNRWEFWVNWITYQKVHSDSPFLLSGYQLSAVRRLGDPFTVLGPAAGGHGGGAAFFPGTGAIGGGILPALGHFGTPTNFPNSLQSPAGLNGPPAIGLGPAIFTDRPSYFNELPFFGPVDFFGFDSVGRPVFGFKDTSSGTGDLSVGTKFNLIDPNKHWFSMALGGYLKIPVARGLEDRSEGRSSGEYEGGPILILGQESGGHRFRLYENIGYIHTGDIDQGGVKVLDLRDKLILNAGMSIALNRHVEFISEVAGTVYVSSGTPNLNPVNPLDLNIGLRFFFKDGAISFGGAYRRFLTNADEKDFAVARFLGLGPFFRTPLFDFPSQQFGEGNSSGFVAYFSIGRRKACPPPPTPTCTLQASASSVMRGDRLSLTVKPTTAGYADGKVSYEYRWDVKDSSGRPVTVSGSGASVEVPTSQLACGNYTVTTNITATVPAVDCPSECVTTGTTSCTTSFSVNEPPCPTVSCDIVASPSSAQAGDRVSLRATARGEGNMSMTWTTTGGTLSSTSGAEVTLDTTGVSGSVTVTVSVATDKTHCNSPCPGGSCSTTVTVNMPPPTEVSPVTPCGPIFFKFNSARINNEHKACLDDIALRLQQDPRASIVVDGHRDASERVGISLTRANNARDYLVTEKGIDSARITVRNFGDSCPHESGDPALNRRVEFWLLPDGAKIEGIKKVCGGGATSRVITDEQPAQSDDKKPPRRRAPRRKKKG
ncbi:MAG: hypothetical protein DMF61_06070 [Blastocatellia bacterium AA13]|nr:MAG: hypothetical protein DMF61_06070 [Blastocatellia bacterium AA13]